MGGIFAGGVFWLDTLILLKVEFIDPCKVFCEAYSGDILSSLRSFIMLMPYDIFSASETKLLGLLTVMHLFLESWLPTAVAGTCVTSDSFCEFLQ